MAHYLITGRSGTGKTTLWHEAQSRGLTAFDGDKVPGLPNWIDLSNGQHFAGDYPGDDQVGKFAWNWDSTVMDELFLKNPDLLLFGNADNATDFYKKFDRVFILTLKPEVQRQRIMARLEHDYGKDPIVQETVISGQCELVEKALALGATAIDASAEPNLILDNILSQI